jgi:DNA-binding beta-propeller fold protein YncE
MAWRPGGNLLVASAGNGRVLEYDGQTGAFAGEFVPPGAGGLAAPRGLRFGPDGNLYVSTDNGRVLRYSPAGVFLDVFVAQGSGGLSGARGLVFTPEGNLLVASFGTDAVLEYDGATGAPLGQWDDGGLDSGIWGLQGPWDLEIGADGNVLVSSNAGNAAVHSYDAGTGGFMRSFYVLADAGPVNGATGIAVVPGDGVDADHDFLPDSCEALPGDLDGDGAVGITDLLMLLAAWGPCPAPCPPSCASDLDGDCATGITDLLALLADWT